MKENSNKIDNEQENFLKKFKGQIQTLGKDGIIGSIGNNNENKIIHFNNFKTNNLKPQIIIIITIKLKIITIKLTIIIIIINYLQ